jgi:phage terminase Nu1 subunit (DNA packaging protein)
MGEVVQLTVNLEEMAAKLRISLSTLRDWMRRHPDFPIIAEGRSGVPWQLDPAAVIAFVEQKRAEETASKAERSELLAQINLPIEDLLPAEERALTPAERLKLAQAMSKEDEVARQRGFLVLTSDMRTRLTEAWGPLAQFLNALPGQVGRRHNLPDAVVRDMRRMIETQQRELHRRLKDLLAPGTEPPAESVD